MQWLKIDGTTLSLLGTPVEAQGAQGITGGFQITVYQRNAIQANVRAPINVTYDYRTSTLNIGTWTVVPPTGTDTLWAQVLDVPPHTTDVVNVTTRGTPYQATGPKGDRGATGAAGGVGPAGPAGDEGRFNISYFLWSATTPADPTPGTWDGSVVSGMLSWARSPSPTGGAGEVLWKAVIEINPNTNAATLVTVVRSSGPQGAAGATGGVGPQGTPGAAGAAGPRGIAGAAGVKGDSVKLIWQRFATAPTSAPTGITYSNGRLANLGAWLERPDLTSGTNPLYAQEVEIVAPDTVNVIGLPYLAQGERGPAGMAGAAASKGDTQRTLYTRQAATPTTPTGITFDGTNFADLTSGGVTWSPTPPTGTDALWGQEVLITGGTNAVAILGTPYRDGTTGARGAVGPQGPIGPAGAAASQTVIQWSDDQSRWGAYQAGDNYIRFSTDGGTTWEPSASGVDLRGPEGPRGRDGVNGTNGINGAEGRFNISYYLWSASTPTDPTPQRWDGTIVTGMLAWARSPAATGGSSELLWKAVIQINPNDNSTSLVTVVRVSGPQGDTGPRGNTGAVGPQGIQGNPGTNGTDGSDGNDGTDGRDADIVLPIFMRSTTIPSAAPSGTGVWNGTNFTPLAGWSETAPTATMTEYVIMLWVRLTRNAPFTATYLGNPQLSSLMLPTAPVAPPATSSYQMSYGLANAAGNPVGVAQMTPSFDLAIGASHTTALINLPTTTTVGNQYYITLPAGLVLTSAVDSFAGDITVNWVRDGQTWRYNIGFGDAQTDVTFTIRRDS